jgi:hypothetical protein
MVLQVLIDMAAFGCISMLYVVESSPITQIHVQLHELGIHRFSICGYPLFVICILMRGVLSCRLSMYSILTINLHQNQ